MKGILLMLKTMGVEITPEQIALLQQYIPQIPALCNHAGQAINGAISQFDTRLQALEQANAAQGLMLARILELTEQNARRIESELQPSTTGSNTNGTGNTRYTNRNRHAGTNPTIDNHRTGNGAD